jgi:predicted negative regulator of RcsB-dependent stress response
VQKYLSGSTVTIPVAHGVEVTLPLNRDAVGLALAELEQQVAGQPQRAIAVVEHLEPSTYAAVSLCDLYLEVGRYDDVVDITNGIPNTDDPTALLAAFRGVALRELGHQTASREALKEALKSKSRDETIRHFALVERAKTYVAENKRAMARKDLERVLAENSNYEGVREMLTALE